MSTAMRAGEAGLQGWREKVADGIAKPVAGRTGLSQEQVRALVGATFLILGVVYVATAAKELFKQAG